MVRRKEQVRGSDAMVKPRVFVDRQIEAIAIGSLMFSASFIGILELERWQFLGYLLRVIQSRREATGFFRQRVAGCPVPVSC